MKLARCPQCDRIIDLDDIEELPEDTVIGCGQKEGDLLPCEGCPCEDDVNACKALRSEQGWTETTVKEVKGVEYRSW